MKHAIKITTAFFMISFVLCSLFFLGCGEAPECKTKSDCASRKCFTVSCASGECDETAVTDCCGNKQCEQDADENYCNCKTDCKEVKNVTAEFMKYLCTKDKTEYALGLSSKDIKLTTASEEIDFSGFTANTKFKVRNPFDVDTAKFEIEFTLAQLEDEVSKPTIKKIELKAEVDDEQRLLAEKEINQILWTSKNKIDAELPVIDLIDDGEEKSIEGLTFFITYEYVEGIGADAEKVSDIADYELEKTINFVNPGFSRKCPGCDDKNPCTGDICSEDTNFFCEHEAKSNCPSNYKCESGENRCTAPKDCGYCTEDYGQYLEMSCDEDDECVYAVKDDKTTSIVKEDSTDFGAGQMATEITYDKPFELDYSELSLNIELKDTAEDFSAPLEIDEIRVVEEDTRLGKVEVGEDLTDIGDTTSNQKISLDIESNVPEFTKSIEIQIDYRYKTKSNGASEESGLQTHTISIDDIEFVKTGPV